MGTKDATEHVDIDWPSKFAELDNAIAVDDALEADLAAAKCKEQDAKTLFKAAMIVVRDLDDQKTTNRHRVGYLMGRYLNDHPVRIIRGTAVAKDRYPDSNMHDFAKDDTILDGADARVFSNGNLRQLPRLGRRGFGLTIRVGRELFIVMPTECELEISDHP